MLSLTWYLKSLHNELPLLRVFGMLLCCVIDMLYSSQLKLKSLPHAHCYFLDIFFLLQVEDNICKFAKKGLTPSQIGVILHDYHGIAQVKSVTGSKVLRILKAHGVCLYIWFTTAEV